jgi:altronate hydrolase
MRPQARTPLLPTASRSRVSIDSATVRLHPNDSVAIARGPLLPRTTLVDGDTVITVRKLIPPGHKVALHALPQGVAIYRYGQVIGFASTQIEPGDHVHTHNVEVHQGELDLDYAFASAVTPVEMVPEAERRTFMGYRRADGRVGTRNYVAILASVNCSSTATRRIADYFRDNPIMDQFPNVDGVVGFPTKGGCGAHYGSSYLGLLQRTMAGIVDHPNVGAYIILSLGCETNQPEDMIEATSLREGDPLVITIQEDGGFEASVAAGIAAVERLLPEANKARREPVPVSEIVLALQCGGSDGWSGVTANPALGRAADEIVRHGGTVVLGETSEVYGGEHLLTRRAVTPEVGQKLVDKIHWWESYTSMFGTEIDNNPSPGNKLGGLTTIYEKSLGAIAKAGTTPMTDVVDYAERITTKGFVHMDTPGYDPVSATGQVAGGCNLICFTTGRGSAFGFKPAPSIKIATNSDLYRKQEPDMDINAGKMLDGVSLDEMGLEIFEHIIAVASGEQTKSERQGIGEEEFNPWIIGATL